jgi:uncharacterized protein (DUF39 family)
VKRGPNGVPRSPAGTIAVIGDLKSMKAQWLRGSSFEGYGATLTVGLGIPIPILNEEIAKYTAVRDEKIYTQIVDYYHDYPEGQSRSLGEVNYKQLRSGSIKVRGKNVPTASLSSYAKAREIAGLLKSWIEKGDFLLTEPVALLPSAASGVAFKSLKERPIKD